MSKFIAYYRVSTAKQGRSGLGLDAQRVAVREYLASNGWPPVEEFTEQESGRNNDRIELMKAIAACRVHKATLIIAKLDRLARNAAFLLNLRDAGIDFIACDMPDANKLTVGIMAVVAQDEAERISARTKAALAIAKERGTKLGGFRGYVPTNEDRERSAAALKAKTSARAKDLQPIVEDIKAAGANSLREIAAALNEKGITTARGKMFKATSVKRLLDQM